MPLIPFDYEAFDYEVFVETLLTRLDLHSDIRVLPYGIDINPKGHLDAFILLWLIAHAPPEAVAEAERQSRRREV
ncbi:MAG: hypothetical protein DPW18_17650 [Chloroflexi bacterium]|nr:hypothetical protein [Chloroflexota bacterium]MDL1941006.1 hypothetical protein [Chloroflexi bacterium CFX2]